jgi:ABC-type thiamine transport system ATPase subunit
VRVRLLGGPEDPRTALVLDQGRRDDRALVGRSAPASPTIFNLLLPFLDPQRGRIILDGRDISP